MVVWLLSLLLGLFSPAFGQLMGGVTEMPSILGNLNPTAPAPNPAVNLALYSVMMADPSTTSFSMMPLLAQNPNLLQNPMSLMMLSSTLGIDMHKLAGPIMMSQMGGGGWMGGMRAMGGMGGMGGGNNNLMSLMPLIMNSDPSTSSLLLSSLMGGMGTGLMPLMAGAAAA